MRLKVLLKCWRLFFDFAHLHCYKEILCEAFLYVHKKKVYKKDYPGQVIVFYTALRSFLKVCFLLQYKNKKWKVKKPSDCMSKLHLASLTMEEYEILSLYFKEYLQRKPLMNSNSSYLKLYTCRCPDTPKNLIMT